VDLARLAGFTPASVICEILKEDGSMARLPELMEFARAHNLKIGTIADLIRYRMENESSVQRIAEGTLPTEFGEFRAVAYHDDIEDKIHLALIKGEVRRDVPILVRVHVHTSLWDLLADMHRVESWTLRTALARVAAAGAGIVVILDQQEPAAEWVKHLRHFHQSQGSLESKPVLDREELRTYGLGSQILADLGVSKMRVLSHPKKAPGISGFGLEVVEYISVESESSKEKQKSR
jgi:3,4-dihydroxy 2-butanone 4-phosphate synthase / GTP cyclohydrolase II